MLPSVTDAIRDFRCRVESEAEALQEAAATGEDMESPAARSCPWTSRRPTCRWPVDPKERHHCYTVHYKKGWLIQWLFLCLALTAVPLAGLEQTVGGGSEDASRFAAGAMVQIPVFLDDPTLVAAGHESLTACALELRESGVAQWRAGPRGHMDRGRFQVALGRQARVGGAVEDDS